MFVFASVLFFVEQYLCNLLIIKEQSAVTACNTVIKLDILFLICSAIFYTHGKYRNVYQYRKQVSHDNRHIFFYKSIPGP